MGRGKERQNRRQGRDIEGYLGLSRKCSDDGTHVRGNGIQVKEELQKMKERLGQVYIWTNCLKNFTLCRGSITIGKKCPKNPIPPPHISPPSPPFFFCLASLLPDPAFELREGETEQAENAFYPASPRFAYGRKALLYPPPHLCLPCFTSPQGNARFTKTHWKKITQDKLLLHRQIAKKKNFHFSCKKS